MVYIVSIDGTIGSGKSTIIESLSHAEYQTRAEPIDDWSLLGDFYRDPYQYAGMFQMQVLLSYHKLYRKIFMEPNMVVIERSPETSKNVFNNMQHARGHIKNAERIVYELYYERLAFIPDHVIYLQTDPDRAYDRCISRNRISERDIPRSYFYQLHEQYENFMNSRPEVTFVDANRDHMDVYADVVGILKRLNNIHFKNKTNL